MSDFLSTMYLIVLALIKMDKAGLDKKWLRLGTLAQACNPNY
jgi:hypothetical protein